MMYTYMNNACGAWNAFTSTVSFVSFLFFEFCFFFIMKTLKLLKLMSIICFKVKIRISYIFLFTFITYSISVHGSIFMIFSLSAIEIFSLLFFSFTITQSHFAIYRLFIYVEEAQWSRLVSFHYFCQSFACACVCLFIAELRKHCYLARLHIIKMIILVWSNLAYWLAPANYDFIFFSF